MRILVTGSAGAIGRAVVPALQADGHTVRGFDRAPDPRADEHRQADLTDAVALDAAVAGCDAILHLGGTPDQADFEHDLVPNNIVATARLLDAAVAHGVATVVLASTLRVVAGWRRREHEGPLGVDVRTRPHDHYSASKVAVEALGEAYVRRHALRVIAARIGWFLRNGEERRQLEGHGAGTTYLSPGDAGRFACAAVRRGEPGFHPIYVMGPAGAERYDLAYGEREIGFRGQDRFPVGAPPLDASAEA